MHRGKAFRAPRSDRAVPHAAATSCPVPGASPLRPSTPSPCVGPARSCHQPPLPPPPDPRPPLLPLRLRHQQQPSLPPPLHPHPPLLPPLPPCQHLQACADGYPPQVGHTRRLHVPLTRPCAFQCSQPDRPAIRTSTRPPAPARAPPTCIRTAGVHLPAPARVVLPPCPVGAAPADVHCHLPAPCAPRCSTAASLLSMCGDPRLEAGGHGPGTWGAWGMGKGRGSSTLTNLAPPQGVRADCSYVHIHWFTSRGELHALALPLDGLCYAQLHIGVPYKSGEGPADQRIFASASDQRLAPHRQKLSPARHNLTRS